MTAAKVAQRTPGPWMAVTDGRTSQVVWARAGIIERDVACDLRSADAAFIVRAANHFDRMRDALRTIANVGSGEAQRVALKTLRAVDE